MGKIISVIGFLLLLSFPSIGQQLNKVSTNPLQLFVFGLNNIEYERGFREGKFGLSFYGSMSGSSVPAHGGYEFHGAEQSFSFKVYTNKFDRNSFWYGGKLSLATGDIFYDYDFSSSMYDDPEFQKYINNRAIDISTLGLTGIAGYQFILSNFYLDLFGGIGYAVTNDLFGGAEYLGEIEESDLLLNYGLRVGVSF